jgi:hypothetical protein
LSSLWKKITTVGSLNPLGRRDVESSSASYVSADYAATATVKPRTWLNLETAFGVQYYRKQTEAVLARGETFPVNDLETISSGALKTAQENFVETRRSDSTSRSRSRGATVCTSRRRSAATTTARSARTTRPRATRS